MQTNSFALTLQTSTSSGVGKVANQKLLVFFHSFESDFRHLAQWCSTDGPAVGGNFCRYLEETAANKADIQHSQIEADWTLLTALFSVTQPFHSLLPCILHHNHQSESRENDSDNVVFRSCDLMLRETNWSSVLLFVCWVTVGASAAAQMEIRDAAVMEINRVRDKYETTASTNTHRCLRGGWDGWWDFHSGEVWVH